MKLTYLLIAAIPLVQTLVEAGAYTLNACHDSMLIAAWDSDGTSGSASWTKNYVQLGRGTDSPNSYTKMHFEVQWPVGQATIAYKGVSLSWKSPNKRIVWNGVDCFQYWGSY
jgi:hypothetical protein